MGRKWEQSSRSMNSARQTFWRSKGPRRPTSSLSFPHWYGKWIRKPPPWSSIPLRGSWISRRVLRKGGAAAHRGLTDARQGRTTNAMPKHRGGVLTPRPPLSRRCPAVTPLCPTGFACAALGGLAGALSGSAGGQAARLDGTGPSASLGVLAVAHGYACELPPAIWPHGARNAARPLFSTPF